MGRNIGSDGWRCAANGRRTASRPWVGAGQFLLAIGLPISYNYLFVAAGVAQLVEHLICNQRVGGSSPFASSTAGEHRRQGRKLRSAKPR